MFHVGLLCAQASPNLRPPMWKVVEMLSGRDHKAVALPRPTQPPFINVKGSSGKTSVIAFMLHMKICGVQSCPQTIP